MAKPKQRENYGNGSITPELDKDGNQKKNRKGQLVWRVCLSFGYETVIDGNGNKRRKRNKVQRMCYGSLGDARKFCKQLQAEYENIDQQAAQGSFRWACDKWLSWMRAKGGASQAVLRQYTTWLGYMSDVLGDKKLVEVKKSDVEAAMVAVKTSRDLSNTTMNKMFAVTKRLFEYCVDSDWITRNPCRNIEAPAKDRVTSRHSLTDEESAVLRKRLDLAEADAISGYLEKENRQSDHNNLFGRSCVRGLSHISGIIAIRIMLATGMRRGEVCGLTWGAVDFDNSQIYVRQSLTASVEVKDPKTYSGRRSLFVEQNTMRHLKEWKTFQAKALHMVMPDGTALTQTDETPVCCSDVGGWLDPTNLSRWWGGNKNKGREGFRDSLGFPELNMHELRHTQATMLLGNGIDVKSVQTRLGHSRASVTLDQYAHAIPANDKAAADLMGEIMNKSVPETPVVRIGESA
ncbi:Integrase [Slackia heliotrinireducens]|uniref:Site-specific recombinase XerD n=1 Tax=Slackia heliotrinireducens (strain ATCC 29202 / DSM 20476 / NCTC 11029 / RHS 1) TaxID=471855 RepID=C7N4Q2_SLAHD|nr:site-specific integrase [Slackia heliotrinireducens]ACV21887.1 site-specific recombinase XerD [Slackia heliotrinireducens DSM 20476]VEG99673.1 Integrase [Slackia heliotrinireducens]